VPRVRQRPAASGVHPLGEGGRASPLSPRPAGTRAAVAPSPWKRPAGRTTAQPSGRGVAQGVSTKPSERRPSTTGREIGFRYCRGCLDKQRQIDELKAELVRVKARLRYQERTAREGPFGSSTPSARIPIKASSLPERQQRRGGGKPGHPGHGRQAVAVDAGEPAETIRLPDACPHCGARLQILGSKRRALIDCQPIRMIRRVLRLQRKRCPRCRRVFQAHAPGVFPKSLYGNQLLAHVAVQHYVYGVTLGQLERQTGIGYSSLVQALHGLARRLAPVLVPLRRRYRRARVKHADETGWRTDGKNGYAWLFATPKLSLFRFRKTRSAQVVREVLGPRRLPGVLIVDRYNAYNRAPCRLNYCYAHLKRDVEDLAKEFPDNPEVLAFVEAFAPLLGQAIHLRTLRLSLPAFRRQAHRIQQDILRLVAAPASHPAVQKIQNLFREKADRLYAWTRHPSIPADNNLAERELRPLVIARKISFGSQSDAGAQTREVLMSVLLSLKKRTPQVQPAFKAALDALAEDPTRSPYALLFSLNSS